MAIPSSFEEVLRQVREAEEQGNPDSIASCFICKHIMFYYPADKAGAEGHIYSTAGLEEVRISSTCEHCFDKITADPDLTPEEQEQERLATIEAFEEEQFREAMRGLNMS